MKKVCQCLYVHKSNIDELFQNIGYLEKEKILSIIKSKKENGFDFQVIKYNVKDRKLSLIQSPDWDTANEPIVGDSFMIDIISGEEKLTKKKPNNPQIYHSKELFVAPDYKGFDIAKAKERTKLWNSIPNINKNKIGYKNYWIDILSENGIEI